jgi:hypothetical protein
MQEESAKSPEDPTPPLQNRDATSLPTSRHLTRYSGHHLVSGSSSQDNANVTSTIVLYIELMANAFPPFEIHRKTLPMPCARYEAK